MYRRAAMVALFLETLLHADPQSQPPDAAPEPIVLKSTSHAVQLDVFVTDPSGRPVHGLQKSEFVVTDDGRPRDIRIFPGEIDANQAASPSTAREPAPGMYSNRLGMRDSRIVTVIVIDAAPRPEGLQKNTGLLASTRPEFWFSTVRWQAINAIHRMTPGQTMAIYAASPDLRIVQDYTSDPDRLEASLQAFVPPPLPKVRGKKQPQKIDVLVPPMLSALRGAAARMSGASGRKSVIWVSQAYGTDLDLSSLGEATDATIDAFNNARIPLYAVDARFSPTCDPPDFSTGIPGPGQVDRAEVVTLRCAQPPDVSDEWMRYLANNTGGRAFSAGAVSGVRWQEPSPSGGGPIRGGSYRLEMGGHGLIDDALRFAVDDSRYAYVMGFYVPEAEMDGKVHTLSVTLPGKPRLELRYRTRYTASASVAAPPAAQELAGTDSKPEPVSALNADRVGIDAKAEIAAKNELRVSLSLAPETVTKTTDGVVVLDATFTQTGVSGKQLAKFQDTVRVSAPETPTEMVPYSRALKLISGAILLHIRIRDQATNRVGTIAIPIGKQ
ncbi:MAG TPA: VWA domain-containing protein [Bryobacteraceae bacterium]|nr:VWA domain-containing protein [Bryobacteraceae bacterium]